MGQTLKYMGGGCLLAYLFSDEGINLASIRSTQGVLLLCVEVRVILVTYSGQPSEFAEKHGILHRHYKALY